MVAIEAQERVFYALAGNIALNNCFNARAVWTAVGAAAGSIGVPIVDYSVPSSFGSLELHKTDTPEYIGQAVDYGNVQLTAMLSTDDMHLARLDLLKIDVEGMEMNVLQGGRQTIAGTRPQLIIEKIKIDETQLSAFLTGLGYRTFEMGINVFAVHEADPAGSQVRFRPDRTRVRVEFQSTKS